ncbi:FCD domain-containing protein [Pseudopelagicola sp. nBUS_19]|uniref:FCD domain-containing protein n=1 Tax=Pseudopelagicola sp. nBUS_19 TaxID=3395316 RepID=UPI003EBE4D36
MKKLMRFCPKMRWSDVANFWTLMAVVRDQIIAACGNYLIIDHYRQVNSLSDVSRARRKFTAEEYQAALGDHNAVLTALKAGDVETFRSACSKHI